jgi:hypothetical protein
VGGPENGRTEKGGRQGESERAGAPEDVAAMDVLVGGHELGSKAGQVVSAENTPAAEGVGHAPERGGLAPGPDENSHACEESAFADEQNGLAQYNRVAEGGSPAAAKVARAGEQNALASEENELVPRPEENGRACEDNALVAEEDPLVTETGSLAEETRAAGERGRAADHHSPTAEENGLAGDTRAAAKVACAGEENGLAAEQIALAADENLLAADEKALSDDEDGLTTDPLLARHTDSGNGCSALRASAGDYPSVAANIGGWVEAGVLVETGAGVLVEGGVSVEAGAGTLVEAEPVEGSILVATGAGEATSRTGGLEVSEAERSHVMTHSLPATEERLEDAHTPVQVCALLDELHTARAGMAAAAAEAGALRRELSEAREAAERSARVVGEERALLEAQVRTLGV